MCITLGLFWTACTRVNGHGCLCTRSWLLASLNNTRAGVENASDMSRNSEGHSKVSEGHRQEMNLLMPSG